MKREQKAENETLFPFCPRTATCIPFSISERVEGGQGAGSKNKSHTAMQSKDQGITRSCIPSTVCICTYPQRSE